MRKGTAWLQTVALALCGLAATPVAAQLPAPQPQSGAPIVTVTIPPGTTSAQACQILQATPNLTETIAAVPDEGSLIDGTYRAKPGLSRNAILLDLQGAARHALSVTWAGRAADLPYADPKQMLILASIVQKEGWPTDYPKLAGLYVNRLRRHMRLQADSTIVYGLVGGKGSLGHAISRVELDKPTPYNTYIIEGLPPGPIDNPSAAALQAVAHPMATSALYVTPDGNGGLVFAETVEAAKTNIQRWREVLKSRAAPKAPP